jgi:hypothetical protein
MGGQLPTGIDGQVRPEYAVCLKSLQEVEILFPAATHSAYIRTLHNPGIRTREELLFPDCHWFAFGIVEFQRDIGGGCARVQEYKLRLVSFPIGNLRKNNRF